MDQPTYVSTADVARAFGVSHKTVVAWIKAGKLAAIQPSGENGAYRIPAAEVARLHGSTPLAETGHAYPVLLHLCLALALVTLLAAALPGQTLAVVAGAALAGLGAGVLWLTVQVCSVVRALDDHP